MLSDFEKLETPQNRKAIVVLESCDYEEERMNRKSKYLDNNDIAIIDLSNPKLKNSNIYQKLYKENLLSSGNVLLQNPYYWDIYTIAQVPNNLIDSNVLTKYQIFANFCAFLGAKSVKIKKTILKNSDGEYIANSDFKRYFFKSRSKLSQQRIDEIYKSLQINNKYKEQDPNEEQARLLLERTHLTNDPTLLEMLKIYNRYKHFDTTMNLTSQSNNILKIASEITLPTWLKFGLEFEKKIKTKEEINIKISVDFY